ncbi:hypothetical protein [Paenibacillus chibensis]|uniref:hypothetical protein n=1 Tax=Paenibacillus chibensis TaxID=59846 RepID=UPI000FD7D63A|nr:hypothetical protein [Paenibacillus chibensis]MEC0369201.1 hypothetical protein [Paenibacillus chibensis]
MKQIIIVISDYREGQPVVASVRYLGLMKHLADKYDIIAIHNRKYGESPVPFATESYTFVTLDSRFSNLSEAHGKPARSGIGKKYLGRIIRRNWIVSSWANYKFSKFTFRRLNRDLYQKLSSMTEKEVAAIYTTIPDVYGLYLAEYLQQLLPSAATIIEIRDILNHDIGQGQPRFILKRVENKLSIADGIVAVSAGIQQYYRKQHPSMDIELIRNGFDEEYFYDCSYRGIRNSGDQLILSHIGSIYKGRSIRVFVEGLSLFHQQTGIKVVFQVIGLLDRKAYEDIHSLKIPGEGVEVRIMGSVDHETAVSLLTASDIAVILTHPNGSHYAIPGKTFEYIGACKPVLAVTKDEELRSLISGRYGECAVHDSAEVADTLQRMLQLTFDFSERMEFGRTLQAERIIRFMDQKIKR